MLTFVQWYIRKLGDGKFALAIETPEGPKYFVQDGGRNVVGGERPPSTPWVIKGPDGGPYTLVPLGLCFIVDVQNMYQNSRSRIRRHCSAQSLDC